MPSLSRAVALGSLCAVVTAAGLAGSLPSYAATTPSFVQQATGHGAGTSLAVTTASATTAGNRLVV